MTNSSWKSYPFDEAVQVNPSVSLARGTVYPYVDMQAIDPNSRSVRPSEHRQFSGGGSRFEHGDTLMGRITPCLENGKIARFVGETPTQPAHGSTEFIVIRGRDGVSDTSFAYYLTRWDAVRGYAISQMTGTSGRQRVPTSALHHLTVSIPSLDEQRAIAHVLGTLDDKIELNRRVNETLEGIARAIFKSWFVDFDPIRAKAEGRDPGLPKPIADLFPNGLQKSLLGDIPIGWRAEPLSVHVEAAKGLSYKGAGLCEEGVPLHNLNSVYEGGGYKYEGIKHYDGEYKDRHIVRPGDIIVTNTEQGHDLLLIGYPGIVPRRFGEWGLFSHHLFRVRCRPTSPVKRFFLYYMLMTPYVRDQITGHTNGTTVNMLASSGLEMPLIVVPAERIVAAFEATVGPIWERIEQTHEENPALEATRDTLLPKLLSGELRITNVEAFLRRVQ